MAALVAMIASAAPAVFQEASAARGASAARTVLEVAADADLAASADAVGLAAPTISDRAAQVAPAHGTARLPAESSAARPGRGLIDQAPRLR